MRRPGWVVSPHKRPAGAGRIARPPEHAIRPHLLLPGAPWGLVWMLVSRSALAGAAGALLFFAMTGGRDG